MAQRKPSGREQRCISECIFKHWNDSSKTAPQRREEEYEQCLTNCQICS